MKIDIKRQILTGKALKEEQVDIMIDNVIKKVQQTADERPVKTIIIIY